MKPWTRQPNESAKAFHNFETFRDMGHERSIRKAAKKLAKDPKSLAKQSKANNWQERTLAWDAYVGELKAEETAKAIVEMCKRHIEGAQMFEDIAVKVAGEFKDRLETRAYPTFDETFYDMKTEKLVTLIPKYFRVFNDAAALERTERGLKEPMYRNESAVEEDGPSIENPGLTDFDEELIEERIDEIAQQENYISKSEDHLPEKRDIKADEVQIPPDTERLDVHGENGSFTETVSFDIPQNNHFQQGKILRRRKLEGANVPTDSMKPEAS
jgi:hypothetical protein